MGPPKNDKGRKNKIGFLDEATLDYYRRVFQTLTSDIDGEEKELFLNNVISQLETEALRVCQNQTASRFVEKLLVDAKPEHILQLLTAFKSQWSTAFTDRFASHVLQDLISLSPKCVQGGDKENRQSMISLMDDIQDFVSENIGTLMLDTYGSHILRVLLEVLGGIDVSADIIRSRVSRFQKNMNKEERLWPGKENPPEEYEEWFDSLVKKLFAFCNYSDHLTDPSSSPVFQTVLLILDKRDPSLCQKHMKKIQKKTGLVRSEEEEGGTEEEDGGTDKQGQSLPRIVQDEAGSYLVEQIVNISASRGKLRKVYDKVFKGRLLFFAVDERANFILQKLIDRIEDKELFEEMFDDLSTHIEDILAIHHIGILTKMAASCVRLHTRQEKLVKVLMEAFHCATPDERQSAVTPLLLTLSTYDVYFNSDQTQEEENETSVKPAVLTNINYHGSVLLQQLLRFGKTRLLVTSLLELQPVELKTLSCDSCGSHVIDVFCESDTVGEKKRDLLLQKLQPLLFDIGCDRNGSRTLEAVWKNCSMKQKTLIAEELSKHEDKLRSNRFGHFLHRNFSISTFKNRRNAWINEQGLENKKKKLMRGFLSEGFKEEKSDRQPHPSGGHSSQSGQSRSEEDGADCKLPNNLSEDEEDMAIELLDKLVRKHKVEEDSVEGDRKRRKEDENVGQKKKNKKLKKDMSQVKSDPSSPKKSKKKRKG